VRHFTGRHAAMIIVAFFAVVIAVNVFMARMAISTFGGIVVENSYVASQDYNKWLDEAAREKALGWKAAISRGAQGKAVFDLADAQGRPLVGAKVSVNAVHPLGRVPDHALTVGEISPGHYEAALEPGRWRLRVTVTAQGHSWRTVGDLQ
jgi:nitrogen fixation protein FixH